MMKRETIRLTLADGSVVLKKAGTGKFVKKFRQESLENRTQAEMWAEEILKINFIFNKDFIPEYPFKHRRFDFFFPLARVALEIDGGYHDERKQKLLDEASDKFLYKNHKIITFRVKNFDHRSLREAIESIKPLVFVYNQKQSKKDANLALKRERKLKRRAERKRTKASNKSHTCSDKRSSLGGQRIKNMIRDQQARERIKRMNKNLWSSRKEQPKTRGCIKSDDGKMVSFEYD